MARSMYVEIQPWITVFKVQDDDFAAPRSRWVDASGFEEVMFQVSIATISHGTGAGLMLQTALTDDAQSMALMKNPAGLDSAFDEGLGPQAPPFIVRPKSQAPLRRWVRWALSPDVTSITFRIAALFRSTS